MPQRLEVTQNYTPDFEPMSAPSSADFYFPRPRLRKLREVPYDSLGIPLPIIPSEDFDKGPKMSRHHEHYLYGSQNFISVGGVALRAARIIRAETKVHNERRGLHYYWDMSPGPRSMEGRKIALVFSAAGYIPEQGIDLWSGSPEIRSMESGEREILTALDPKKPEFYKNFSCDKTSMRKFFEKIILKQPFNKPDIEKLETLATSRRLAPVRDIGDNMLRNLVDSAVSSLKDDYVQASQKGLLHPNAPTDPADIIMESFGDETRVIQAIHPIVRRKAKRHLILARQPLQTGVDRIELAA